MNTDYARVTDEHLEGYLIWQFAFWMPSHENPEDNEIGFAGGIVFADPCSLQTLPVLGDL